MNKILLIVITILFHAIDCNEIQIIPIQDHHIKQARQIIINAVLELQIIPCFNSADLEIKLEKENELGDLKNIKKIYTENKGTFLVMLIDYKVVGMGAIKYLTNDICELKRMFFDPEYRGKGFGSKMLEILIHKAKELGYKKIQLEVYNQLTQTNAVALYTKFGFHETKPYLQSPKFFMEKIL